MEKIVNRLDRIHQKLLAAVMPLDCDQFNLRPAENEWSVAEIVHHLCLVEQRVIKELENGLAGPRKRPGLMGRMIPPAIVGSRLVRVKAPKAVTPTNPPHKEQVITNFEAARHKLKQLCSVHGKKQLRHVVLNHPFLGKIDGTAAVSFVGYHELRHYKQIIQVLKRL